MSAPQISRPTAFEARIADRKEPRYPMTIGLDLVRHSIFLIRPRKGAGLGMDAVVKAES